jgi:exopolysaccharide production protein ExoQ
MSFRIFERLFIVVLFLSSMGVVDALTRPSTEVHDPTGLSTEVPLSTALIESTIYVWGAILVLMRPRRVFRAAHTVWPVLGLAALATLSIAWSIQPMLTVRRSASLLASTLLGIYLGERFSIEQLARLLAQALCLMIIAVVLLYFVAPAYVMDASYSGAWKGLSVAKNSFGGYMAIAVILLLLVRFRYFRWFRYVFLIAAAVLLLLSRSATSLLGCALMLAAMPLWRLARLNSERRFIVYTVAPLVVLASAYSIAANTELLFQVLGRDSTLTGRTHLWSMVLPAIVKHPVVGYGYGAFWTGLRGEALNVLVGSRWLVRGADNGYLELCLSLGVVGLAVFLCVLVIAFRMANQYLRSDDRPIGFWPITYFTLFMVHNVCESHLLETRSLEFLLFVALTTSLALSRCQREVMPPRRVPDLHAALANDCRTLRIWPDPDCILVPTDMFPKYHKLP